MKNDLRVVIETFYDDEGKQIGELVIESDGMQFIVKQTTTVTKSATGEHQVIHGYFPTIESAVKAIVKMKIMESTATDLKGLRADFLRLEAWIHELIQF